MLIGFLPNTSCLSIRTFMIFYAKIREINLLATLLDVSFARTLHFQTPNSVVINGFTFRRKGLEENQCKELKSHATYINIRGFLPLKSPPRESQHGTL